MTYSAGTIVYLAGGSGESQPAPGLAELAAALGARLSTLSPEHAATPGQLRDLAANDSGILALLPAQLRAVSRLLVGSEYERWLRSGLMPILSLPDGAVQPIRRVLFPADLSPRSAAAFQGTLDLCAQLGAELDILHVFGDDRLLPEERDQAARAAAKSPRALFDLDRAKLRAMLDAATQRGLRARFQTAEGRAHAQIAAYAADNAIDLIVMSTHGLRSMEDVLLGSTTVRVVQQARVPVLAMRG